MIHESVEFDLTSKERELLTKVAQLKLDDEDAYFEMEEDYPDQFKALDMLVTKYMQAQKAKVQL